MSEQLNINPEMDKLARDDETILVSGCGDCPFLRDSMQECFVNNKAVIQSVANGHYGDGCPLLTHSIKVMKYEACGTVTGQPTLVQKPFDVRIALAIFSDRDTKNEIRTATGVPVYSFGETMSERGSDIPRYSAKTTGNFDIVITDSYGKSIDGNKDNDLIIFVWE
jgi:hypothetical protein